MCLQRLWSICLLPVVAAVVAQRGALLLEPVVVLLVV
jgi:hypothetical protein